MFKIKIERTTTNDVIQIGTSQVKLGGEFNGPIVIDDQVDTVMEDAAPDHEEEKANKVVGSKYLQPRWCPPGLTAPKRGCSNDYDLQRCEKRSKRSGGMNCSMRSSLGPYRNKNGSRRRHLEALQPSQLSVDRL
jgi:hypothetical protein